jgi:ribosomal protein L7/L12
MPICRHCGGLITAEAEPCPKCGAPPAGKEEQAPPAGSLTPWQERVLELMRQGQKIEAIKVHREATGAGLKDSKDAVEALAVQHGVPVSSAGCSKAAAVLAAMMLALFASAVVVLTLI